MVTILTMFVQPQEVPAVGEVLYQALTPTQVWLPSSVLPSLLLTLTLFTISIAFCTLNITVININIAVSLLALPSSLLLLSSILACLLYY